ncbi:hypothetical protein FKP32DRAFT_1589666 [Trametes sanguinea]|nr:hypothetical protein FKP32DRAFT_1589666 [Trametes sanguinea]
MTERSRSRARCLRVIPALSRISAALGASLAPEYVLATTATLTAINEVGVHVSAAEGAKTRPAGGAAQRSPAVGRRVVR